MWGSGAPQPDFGVRLNVGVCGSGSDPECEIWVGGSSSGWGPHCSPEGCVSCGRVAQGLLHAGGSQAASQCGEWLGPTAHLPDCPSPTCRQLS